MRCVLAVLRYSSLLSPFLTFLASLGVVGVEGECDLCWSTYDNVEGRERASTSVRPEAFFIRQGRYALLADLFFLPLVGGMAQDGGRSLTIQAGHGDYSGGDALFNTPR